jgi:hypothetical protein
MNIEDFKRYIQSRKKLDSEFKTVPNLDTQYNKYLDDKKKVNERTKQWYQEKIQIDEDFKQKRKEYNKKSYETLKTKKGIKTDVKQNEPIIKINMNVPEPKIIENRIENEVKPQEQRKIISMFDVYNAI